MTEGIPARIYSQPPNISDPYWQGLPYYALGWARALGRPCLDRQGLVSGPPLTMCVARRYRGDVNLSPVSLVAVGAASLVMVLAGCGSDTDTQSATTTSTSPTTDVVTPPSSTQTPPEDAPCPMAAPAQGGAPDWTLAGATGNVAVTGPTDKAAPQIEVQAPFSVTETQVQTLQPGDGPVVVDTATVLVCYIGVNGRDGTVFDSTYDQGAPIDFSLTGVVPGFQKAIAGQNVGSTVAVAMTAADGYPEGQPAAGIQPGDSLVFAIKILDAAN